MTTARLQTASVLNDEVIRRRRVKAILLPVEHGGWGLTIEPLVAGMIVAPSLAGLAISVAILMAFLARQPFRIVSRPGANPERFRIALTALAVEGLIGGGMVALALALGAGEALLLLVAASPLAFLLLYRDRERRSRDVTAELAAALFMACGGVAIVVAGGEPFAAGLILGAMMAARSIGAVLHVREQVKVMKERPSSRSASIVVHAAALSAAIVGVGYGLVNLLAPAAFAVLFARAVYPPHPSSPAQLGWVEVKAGLVAVLLISLSL